MYKIDKIKGDQCNKLIVEPVFTACGYSVCNSHVSQLKNTFKCELCHVEHEVPKQGFVVNRKVQDALDIQLNTLELTPIYEECKQAIEESQKNVVEIESMGKDSENYIYEYFEDIKRQVDLRREDLKSKIDTFSDETIESINNTQLECRRLSKDINKLTKDFEDSKTELNRLINEFDTFKIDEKKFANIKDSVTILKDQFKEMCIEYKSSLIDYKEFTFCFKEIPISDIFGNFDEVN